MVSDISYTIKDIEFFVTYIQQETLNLMGLTGQKLRNQKISKALIVMKQ
ncbi:hypothetical protein M20_0850 [Lactococcus lactis subsp. lactis]|uniref:Uncharacterized protein n=1 Tax=Lactococcus lactis subsp. lactis TaxID=1360 RepID=A0A0V8E741_LACLL|nr:hypothetical protein M20_0850 [Lactococcus lactis subsp. lactis]